MRTFITGSHISKYLKFDQYSAISRKHLAQLVRLNQHIHFLLVNNSDRMRPSCNNCFTMRSCVRVRMQQGVRLSQARESTLDYRLGIKSSAVAGQFRRPNPASLKGWASLVEDRIEVCQRRRLVFGMRR